MDGKYKKRTARAVLAGLFMAALWSTWGFYVNYEYGEAIAMRAAVTQGVLNFTFNMIGVYILEFMYGIFWGPTIVRCAMAIVGTFSITTSSVYLGHYLSGTPEIVMTIGPAISVAFVFSIIYLIGYVKLVAPETAAVSARD